MLSNEQICVLVNYPLGLDPSGSSHRFRGGSWWHDAWSGVKNVGKAVTKVAPMTAETPLIGPEIAAGAETVGRVAHGVGTVGSLLTNTVIP